MKTKLFIFMMAIGMLLTIPTISYAQGMTDEDLEFEGSDSSNSDFGPVSLDPILVNGVLSSANQTITLNFTEDLGIVTIWIVDENGTLYISKEVNTSKEATVKIDIKSLPAKKYKIICYNPIDNQEATFELRK